MFMVFVPNTLLLQTLFHSLMFYSSWFLQTLLVPLDFYNDILKWN